MAGDLTDVEGIRVGHWSDPTGATGCTVVLLPDAGAVAAVDVRGAAPGTRETDALAPGLLVDRVHAVLLTGGSAFGLAAADGVMRRLEERGVGFATPAGPVPVVPAAVLFDLAPGSPRPGAEAGYAATVAAEAGSPCGSGRVGAGAGAHVGRLAAPAAGGIGTASLRLAGGGTVAAVAAVNAMGDVVAEDGSLLAGSGAVAAVLAGTPPPALGTNTTLAVVATDLPLDRGQAHRLSVVSHDGLARAIRPVHTSYDGDTVFAVATGTHPGPVDQLAGLQLQVAAVEVVAAAVRAAVRT